MHERIDIVIPSPAILIQPKQRIFRHSMPPMVKVESLSAPDNNTARRERRPVGRRLLQRFRGDKDNVVAAGLRECEDILAGAYNRVFKASPVVRNRSASLGCLPSEESATETRSDAS